MKTSNIGYFYAALLRDVDGEVTLNEDRANSWCVGIHEHVSIHGPELVMEDFPAFGKILDKGLSTGNLDFSRIPETCRIGSSINDARSYYFSDLILAIFTYKGELKDEVNPKSIKLLRTCLYACKKLEVAASIEAERSALKGFFDCDRELYAPDYNWDFPTTILDRDRVQFDDTDPYGSVLRQIVHRFTLPELDLSTVYPSNGPGAVADSKKLSDKYQPDTYPRKLSSVFPPECFYRHDGGLNDIETDMYVPRVGADISAKLACVPKTLNKPRIITVEATANVFLQKGLMRWYRESMPSFLKHCYDTRSQEKSRDLVLSASKTGSHASVDLSAASDRLSLWTVERMFACSRSFLVGLAAARSSKVSCDAIQVADYPIRKFAGMGNATTFPVQSTVYAILCIAAVLVTTGKKICYSSICAAARQVRVYGDDLIVPTESVPALFELLKYVQLVVNNDKTHTMGKFRESCGMDAYDGVDVSPFYLKSLTAPSWETRHGSLVSWVDVCNNAYVHNLFHLNTWLKCQLPERLRNNVPESYDSLPCIHLLTATDERLQTRYDPNLQLVVVKTLDLKSNTRRKKRLGYSNLLQWFLEKPKPDLGWDSGFDTSRQAHLKCAWVPL